MRIRDAALYVARTTTHSWGTEATTRFEAEASFAQDLMLAVFRGALCRTVKLPEEMKVKDKGRAIY
jgi:hypothetical protein